MKIHRGSPLEDAGEQAVRDRAVSQIETDPERLLSEYKQKFGNVLNADDAGTDACTAWR